MNQRTLPHTAFAVSPLCLGTADMGTKIDRAVSFRMLDIFHDRGGNFLDTARVYADWVEGGHGVSETLVGDWMASRGIRDRVVIATKGAHPRLESMHLPRMSPADIATDLEQSLRTLRVDAIDLYYVHRDDPARPVEEIVEALATHVRAGKVRYVACSNWRAERVATARAYASRHGLPMFVVNQMLWNAAVPIFDIIGDPTIALMDEAMWRYHRESGMAAAPWGSQANGLFAKAAAGRPPRADSAQAYSGPENEGRVRRVLQLAHETGMTATQIALGYLRGQPFPVVPIVGPQSVAQLDDTLAAASVALTAEQIEFIDRG